MSQQHTKKHEEVKPAPLGRKSELTRRRIIEATKQLISEGKYTAKITDIARAANVAQPHFYIYFSTVQDVVYVIAEELYEASNEDFVKLLKSEWSGEQGFAIARRMVETAIARWRENYALNAICALLADKEEGRFRDQRLGRYELLRDIFAEKIRLAQSRGQLNPNIDPVVRGHLCVGMLMNVAQQYDSIKSADFSTEQILDETTHFVLEWVGFGRDR